MAQRLARRAEDREVPGSSPTPRLTFLSCSRYQLNQLGSKAASESTVKKSNTCGVSNNRLYFFLLSYFFIKEWAIFGLVTNAFTSVFLGFSLTISP